MEDATQDAGQAQDQGVNDDSGSPSDESQVTGSTESLEDVRSDEESAREGRTPEQVRGELLRKQTALEEKIQSQNEQLQQLMGLLQQGQGFQQPQAGTQHGQQMTDPQRPYANYTTEHLEQFIDNPGYEHEHLVPGVRKELRQRERDELKRELRSELYGENVPQAIERDFGEYLKGSNSVLAKEVESVISEWNRQPEKAGAMLNHYAHDVALGRLIRKGTIKPGSDEWKRQIATQASHIEGQTTPAPKKTDGLSEDERRLAKEWGRDPDKVLAKKRELQREGVLER